MFLRELIDALPPDRPILIAGARQYTASDLLQLTAKCISHLANISSNRYTITGSDAVANIAWMIALDGLAEVALLAPESLTHTAVFPEFIDRSGCTTILDGNAVEHAEPDSGTISRSGRIQTKWLLATSGTTGTPKLIEHTTQSLTRTAKVNPQKGAEYTWGLVYDPFRFAGLQVVLQSLASGSLLLLCHLESLPRQLELIRENNVNALSATPTFWRKLLMLGSLENYSFRQITLGGEPADQSILSALAKAFPRARVTHIYASTEAGVGFSVTDARAGFPVAYLEQGTAGNSLRIGHGGTLEIKPAGTAAHLHGGESLSGDDGYIDTGDLVSMKGDRVYFLGRLSGAINVGGNKVMPEEIEAVIRTVPGVADVLVKGKGSTVVGQLVMAEVVAAGPHVNESELKKAILDVCKASLEKFKVPALVKIVPELQYNATGKLIRSN
jgi:acyl-CoA synthetase (AMP-forming)/AMP-acid ligase II